MKFTLTELAVVTAFCAFSLSAQAADPNKAQRDAEYKATVSQADADYKTAKEGCKAREGQ